MFEDKSDVELSELDDQVSIASENSDSDSDISGIYLDQFDDDEDFELKFPKNSVCAAHTLQLALKDVFENCAELKELNQVILFSTITIYSFDFRKLHQF